MGLYSELFRRERGFKAWETLKNSRKNMWIVCLHNVMLLWGFSSEAQGGKSAQLLL